MPNLLLIPGLVSDAFVWHGITARIPATVADVSTQPTITAMAQDLLARHPGRLILAGHSMGGRVAMEMARLAPSRIAGMALLNTGMHPRRDGEEAKRQEKIDLANTHGMAALAESWLPGMMATHRAPDPKLLADLTAMVSRFTPEIHEHQLRALLSRPDAALSMPAWTGPLFLLTGAQDAWSPVSQHQDIAALCPQAILHVIKDAGHFAPVEQPETVGQILADWASKIAAEADRIPETPLFDRPRANAGYALNKMAMGLSAPEGRAAFAANEDAYLSRFPLTAEQRAAVKARDWEAMVRLGGNLFYILKISAVDPTPIRAIGAAQAGLTLQDFLDTRLGKVTNG
jgi:protocatechuate 4,5-dioxygenase alpha subunit